MHVRRVVGRSSVGLVLVMALLAPGAVLAAANGPTEPCVPGQIIEDRASGITWICIYDEIYGGPRWDILPKPDQVSSSAYTARSVSYGCVYGTVGLTDVSGGGGDILVRSFRWPCSRPADRSIQPAGEVRVRTILQRWSSSTWTTCRDTGYQYNTSNTWTFIGGVSMGAAPDCGVGTYRTWGFGHVYQGAAWRGGSLYSPSLWID